MKMEAAGGARGEAEAEEEAEDHRGGLILWGPLCIPLSIPHL